MNINVPLLLLFILNAAICRCEDASVPLENQIGLSEAGLQRLLERSVKDNLTITVIELDGLRPFQPSLGEAGLTGKILPNPRVLFKGSDQYQPGQPIFLYRKTKASRLIMIAGDWIKYSEDAEKLIVRALEKSKVETKP